MSARYVTAADWEQHVREIIDDLVGTGEEWFMHLARSDDAPVEIGQWQINTVQTVAGDYGFLAEFLVEGETGPNDGWSGRLMRRHVLDGEEADDAVLVGKQTVLCLFRCFVDETVHPSLGVVYDYCVAWDGTAPEEPCDA